MRKIIGTAVALALGSAAIGPAPAQPAQAGPDLAPLAFGMNVDQVSQALGTNLSPVRGRAGNQLYVAWPNAKGAALSDRNDALYLQFRRGKLRGWKGDWVANRGATRVTRPFDGRDDDSDFPTNGFFPGDFRQP